MTREEAAAKIAREAVAEIAHVLIAIGMQVHDNPPYWAAYHRAMLASFSPARRAFAWRHRIRLRRAKAAIKAHAALAAVCAGRFV